MAESPIANHRERMILVETIGSVLWFVMDGLWMLNLGLPAKGMILPTLGVNLFVFRYAEHSFSQYAVVAAMNAWLLMNIFWMVGDLDKDPGPLSVARSMFALGMFLLFLAVTRNAMQGDGLGQVLARFRRFRV